MQGHREEGLGDISQASLWLLSRPRQKTFFSFRGGASSPQAPRTSQAGGLRDSSYGSDIIADMVPDLVPNFVPDVVPNLGTMSVTRSQIWSQIWYPSITESGRPPARLIGGV
jgi:hypothetical protein